MTSFNLSFKPCLTNTYVTDKIHRDSSIGLVLPKKNNSSSSNILTEKLSVFSRDKTSCFFESIKNTRDEVLYTVATYTGLRLGKILDLKWSCIDFNNNTITINNDVKK